MHEADPKGRPGGPAPATGASPDADPGRSSPTDIQTYIGTRLREVYNDVARQPIPDRFLELMRELDQTQKS